MKTENISQKATSARTSLKQIPAVFKSRVFSDAVHNLVTDFPASVVSNKARAVLNYGAGRFPELAADFVRENHGVTVRACDKYNLPEDINADALSFSQYPVVVVSNVLNVIDSDAAAADVVRDAVSHMDAFIGVCLITVYEGDGSGNGKYTMNGESYQRNAKTAAYIPLLQTWLGDAWTVTKHGKVIVIAHSK